MKMLADTSHDPRHAGLLWDNRGGPRGAGNTAEGLTHSLDLGKEGLPMNGTRVCSVEGCGRPHQARGWCKVHYSRWRRNGDPEALAPPREPSPPRLCEIDGCQRQHYARGYCSAHYDKWKLYGDPLGSAPRKYDSDVCAVDGCGRPRKAKGYCPGHRRRLEVHGDLMVDTPIRPQSKRADRCAVEGCDGIVNARDLCAAHNSRLIRYGDPTFKPPLAEFVSYRGAHKRVTKKRGRADSHACVDCGGSADQWSYQHDDPDEIVEQGFAYSLSVERYAPRCLSCHIKFDRKPARYLPRDPHQETR